MTQKLFLPQFSLFFLIFFLFSSHFFPKLKNRPFTSFHFFSCVFFSISIFFFYSLINFPYSFFFPFMLFLIIFLFASIFFLCDYFFFFFTVISFVFFLFFLFTFISLLCPGILFPSFAFSFFLTFLFSFSYSLSSSFFPSLMNSPFPFFPYMLLISFLSFLRINSVPCWFKSFPSIISIHFSSPFFCILEFLLFTSLYISFPSHLIVFSLSLWRNG